MYESIFSYNVTRPYPFRWFTPVVFVGGVISIVLFSILNFVSNSTFLSVDTSTNPNTTVSDGTMFKHWPSYLTSKIQPVCQSVDIPVNSKFLTNHSSLTYTLASVSPSASESKDKTSPSLTYHHSILHDCRLNAIEMDLDALDRLAAQLAWAEWGVSLRGYLSCRTGDQTRFNITAEYDYTPETVSFDRSTLPSFIGRDKMARASLWWGESLLSMYWVKLSKSLQDIRTNATAQQEDTLRKGTIYFTLSNITKASVDAHDLPLDVLDPNFFGVEYSFILNQNISSFPVLFHGINSPPTTIPFLQSQGPYPDIWDTADALAKSFLSTITTDLGQNSSPYPNILTNATTLQHYTANFPTILTNTANAQPGPAQQDYNTLRSSSGPLAVTPATIFAKYICQVPKKKSAGSIIVAVLLADLVFLQALWKLLGFGTEHLLLTRGRAGPQVKYCDGCLVRDSVRDEAMEAVQGQINEKEPRQGSPSRQRLLNFKLGGRV